VRRLIRTITAVALALASTRVAGAQLQRRTASPQGGAAVEMPNIPANPRYPFAGAWVGRLTMPGDEPIPIAMIIDVADGKYTGATIWPNGARAPHNNHALSGDALTWQQINSGGGTWHYSLTRTAGDTLVGTMTLHDAPNFPPPLPTGTITLVRNPSR
jgi:hypothetical protein